MAKTAHMKNKNLKRLTGRRIWLDSLSRMTLCFRLLISVFAFASVVFCAVPSFAATRTWDGNGADDNWSTALNWGGTAPVAGDNLIFATPTGIPLRYTPWNNTALNYADITFTAGGFTVAGNATNMGGTITNNAGLTNNFNINLTLGFNRAIVDSGALTVGGTVNLSNKTLTVNTAGNTTVAGVVSGSGNITKSGTGTLTLGAANLYAGATTINNGTLKYGATDAINTGSVTIAGGYFDLAGFSDTVGTVQITAGEILDSVGTGLLASTAAFDMRAGTVSAKLGGTGGLTKTTTSVVTLTGANTYTGTTTLTAGTLIASNIVVSGGSSNLGNAATAVGLGGSGSSKGTLYYTGNTATFTRGFTVNAGGGEIDTVTSGQTLTIGGAIGGTGTLTIGGAGNTTISSVMATGSGALIKNDAGTLTLSAANSYTGATTVNAGTLSYGITNALSTGAVMVSGGVLDMGAAFTDSVGTVTLTSGSIIGNGTLSGTSYAVESGTISAKLGGAGALAKTTAGVITLSGASTYSGTTTITLGTLSVSDVDTGDGSSNLGNASSAVVLGGSGQNKGTLYYTGNTANCTRGFTVNAGGGEIDTVTSGQTLTIETGAVSGSGGDLTIGGAGNTTISSVIATGAGNLIKNDAGTLILGGANTYTGVTTINAGTLTYGASSVIYTGNVTVSGGYLNLEGFTDTVGTVQMTGGGILGAGILTSTAAYDLQAGTVKAVLSGSVGLNKTGAGTVTLSNENTYTGTTTISGGTLAYGANNAIGSGAVTVSSGGVLDIGEYFDSVGLVMILSGGEITGTTGALTGGSYDMRSGVVDAVLDGEGIALTKSTGGTVTLNSNNTYTGLTTVSAGSLTYGTDNALASGDVTVSGGTFDIAGYSDAVGAVTLTGGTIAGTNGVLTGTSYGVQSGAVNAILGGTGIALNKTTIGTVTLSKANTYTGATTVSAGTLTYGTNDAISSGNVTVSGTGYLNLVGFTDTVGTVQMTGGGILGGGTLTSTADFDMQAGTVNAILAGAVGLNKTGSGTVTLSNTNAYTGTTTVSDGTLALNGMNRLWGSGAVNVNGGVLDISGNNNAVGDVTLTSGTIAGSGGTLTGSSYDVRSGTISAILGGAGVTLTKTTADTVTLSGQNTYTGLTTVSAGTLAYGTNDTLFTGSVTVTGGVLDFGDYSDTVGAVNLTGGEIRSGTGVLTGSSYGVESGTVNAVLGGNGIAMTKTNGGTVTINKQNTYTGLTTVNDGTLLYGIDNAIASGNVLLSGGVLDINAYSDTVGMLTLAGGSISATSGVLTANAYELQSGIVYAELTGDNVAVVKNTIGTVTLNKQNTYTGLTTVNDGTLTYGTDNAIFTGGVTVSGGVLNINSWSDTVGAVALTGGTIVGTTGTLIGASYDLYNGTVDAVLGGADITLNKATGGTVILNKQNTYTGLTTVGDGTLSYGTDNAISTGDVTVSGGVLNINSRSDSVGTVTLTNGTITGTTGVLTGTSYGVQSGTVDAILGGPGIALNKTTAGTVTLSKANTYTGLTTVSAGTLTYGTNDAISSGNVTVSGTGYLNLVGFTDTVGTVQMTGGGILGTGTLTSTADFDLQAGTVDAILAGDVGLNKTGLGTVTLSNANTFTGDVTINGGTLAYGAADAISTGNVIVTAGILDIGNYVDSVGAVSLIGGGIVGAGTLTGSSYGVQNGTIDANLGGSGGLTKTGGGTVTMTGTNTYVGPTSVEGGVLILDGSVTSDITVGAGAILKGSGTANLMVLMGASIVDPGDSPGTLNTGDEIWNGAARYRWEINDVDGDYPEGLPVEGGQGMDPGWDLLDITGTLTINAASDNRFIIDIVSLNLGNSAGLVQDFDDTLNYSWIIASTTMGISGFAQNAFTINFDDFANGMGTGQFIITQQDNDLVLKFTHGGFGQEGQVPEPSTLLLLLLPLLGFGLKRRNRINPNKRINKSTNQQ